MHDNQACTSKFCTLVDLQEYMGAKNFMGGFCIHYEVHVCFPEWTAAFSSVHFLHSFLTILSWSCLVICTFIIATIMLDLLCSQSWYCWQQLPSYNKDCKFWGEHCSLLVCILQECQPPQASSVGFLSWSGLLKCTIRKMELSEHS